MDTLELTFEIVFFAIAIPAFIADVLAGVSERARQIGHISTGLLMLLGGAAVNATSLAVGVDYADFADDAKFGWVTDAWRVVVPGHAVLLIGLLVVFEATVGVLILLGGRRAQAESCLSDSANLPHSARGDEKGFWRYPTVMVTLAVGVAADMALTSLPHAMCGGMGPRVSHTLSHLRSRRISTKSIGRSPGALKAQRVFEPHLPSDDSQRVSRLPAIVDRGPCH